MWSESQGLRVMPRNTDLECGSPPEQETEACSMDMPHPSVLSCSILIENLRSSKTNRAEDNCR